MKRAATTSDSQLSLEYLSLLILLEWLQNKRFPLLKMMKIVGPGVLKVPNLVFMCLADWPSLFFLLFNYSINSWGCQLCSNPPYFFIQPFSERVSSHLQAPLLLSLKSQSMWQKWYICWDMVGTDRWGGERLNLLRDSGLCAPLWWVLGRLTYLSDLWWL